LSTPEGVAKRTAWKFPAFGRSPAERALLPKKGETKTRLKSPKRFFFITLFSKSFIGLGKNVVTPFGKTAEIHEFQPPKGIMAAHFEILAHEDPFLVIRQGSIKFPNHDQELGSGDILVAVKKVAIEVVYVIIGTIPDLNKGLTVNGAD
jgi:hypothetical protein